MRPMNYPTGSEQKRLELLDATLDAIHHAWRTKPYRESHEEIGRILTHWRRDDASIRFKREDE